MLLLLLLRLKYVHLLSCVAVQTGRWLRCDGNLCLYYLYILHVQANFHISKDSDIRSPHCSNLKFAFIFLIYYTYFYQFTVTVWIADILLTHSKRLYIPVVAGVYLLLLCVVKQITKCVYCWSLLSCSQRLGLTVRPGLNITVLKAVWRPLFLLLPGWYAVRACTGLGLSIYENFVFTYFCSYWLFFSWLCC